MSDGALILQSSSDHHWEAGAHPLRLHPATQVLVLPGDMHVGTRHHARLQPLIERHGIRIVEVPGNRSFYGGCLDATRLEMRAGAAAAGIDLLDDSDVVIDGVRFVGGTLWTDQLVEGDGVEPPSEPAAVAEQPERVKMFHEIRVGGRRCTPQDFLDRHVATVAYLDRALGDGSHPPESTVVVTHHGCTPHSIHRKYGRPPVNGSYASDLRWLIAKHRPALWLHGHSHASMDYRIGATRVVTNPHGYTPQENPAWHPSLLLRVPRALRSP